MEVEAAASNHDTNSNKDRISEHLVRSMKVTAGCRFIAAKRLELLDRRLTMITAFSSAYVTILTVMPYIIKLPAPSSDLYNLVTTAFSIVILVSSLLQYSSQNVVNAEQHHRCALELNELVRELRLAAEVGNDSNLPVISQRYNFALQKYSVNHDDCDFDRFRIENREFFPWMSEKELWKLKITLILARCWPSFILYSISAIFGYLVIHGAIVAGLALH